MLIPLRLYDLNIWHMSGFCMYTQWAVHSMYGTWKHCYHGLGSELLNFKFCSDKWLLLLEDYLTKIFHHFTFWRLKNIKIMFLYLLFCQLPNRLELLELDHWNCYHYFCLQFYTGFFLYFHDLSSINFIMLLLLLLNRWELYAMHYLYYNT